MSLQWFVLGEDEKEYGPYSASELKKLVSDGYVISETQVRRDGMKKHVRADSVKGLIPNREATEVEVMVDVLPEPIALSDFPQVPEPIVPDWRSEPATSDWQSVVNVSSGTGDESARMNQRAATAQLPSKMKAIAVLLVSIAAAILLMVLVTILSRGSTVITVISLDTRIAALRENRSDIDDTRKKINDVDAALMEEADRLTIDVKNALFDEIERLRKVAIGGRYSRVADMTIQMNKISDLEIRMGASIEKRRPMKEELQKLCSDYFVRLHTNQVETIAYNAIGRGRLEKLSWEDRGRVGENHKILLMISGGELLGVERFNRAEMISKIPAAFAELRLMMDVIQGRPEQDVKDAKAMAEMAGVYEESRNVEWVKDMVRIYHKDSYPRSELDDVRQLLLEIERRMVEKGNR